MTNGNKEKILSNFPHSNSLLFSMPLGPDGFLADFEEKCCLGFNLMERVNTANSENCCLSEDVLWVLCHVLYFVSS